MRIRTQLILASFVLAVLPLTAIVIWSHHSSRKALEAAEGREVARLTRQMDRRLTDIREELAQRLTVVSALPLQQSGAPGGSAGDRAVVGNIVTAMGDVAGLIDSLEFQPIPVAFPSPAPAASGRRAPRPERAERTEPAEPAEHPEPPVPPEPGHIAEAARAHPVPNPNPDFDIQIDPIVIEIPDPPEIPKFVTPDEQRELVRIIGRIARKLQVRDLPAEERAQLNRDMEDARRELVRVTDESRKEYEQQMEAVHEVNKVRRELLQEQARISRQNAALIRDRERQRRAAQAAGGTPPTVALAPVAMPAATASATKATPETAPAKKPEKVVVRKLTEADKQKLKATEKRVELLFGHDFNAEVKNEGAVVGQLSARVRPEEVIQRVLGIRGDDSDEIPFAVDREGNVYTRNEEDKSRLETLGVPRRLRDGKPLTDIEGWIVSVKTDTQSGLRIGAARPVGENLLELKRIAARNFGLGLGLIAFALIGIIPFSNHLTRDVQLVTAGAQRIAHGDLMTRLPVVSKNEIGQLATAFNRMAEDLSVQQQRLLEQERARKEQELQQRLMAVEYDRKSFELEEARRFQLSMLPKEVPQHESYDVAVYTRTATEVGGDYYDFHVDGSLVVTIGDATGHGAKAGTMVTVVKTLFAGFGGQTEPAGFLHDAAEKIKRMDLGRMAMALAIGRFAGRNLTLASAGMPPVLIHRAASNEIEEFAIEATPLGTFGSDYAQTEVEIGAGDTVLFMTDGFPELLNDAGQQFGYTGTIDAFASAASAGSAEGVITALTDIVRAFHGDHPPNDDVTFVAVRVRAV